MPKPLKNENDRGCYGGCRHADGTRSDTLYHQVGFGLVGASERDALTMLELRLKDLSRVQANEIAEKWANRKY